MKKTLLLFLVFSTFNLWAQSNEAYTDEDLKKYIEVNTALQHYRMEAKLKADSMRTAQGLDEQDFLEIIGRVREGENYDSLKTEYPKTTISAFERTMSYRQFLRQGMQNFLATELDRIDWDLDYYQHLALSIEAIPELQQRIIALSK